MMQRRDAASAAWLAFPGMCMMSNRHGKVRCFSRNSQELVISSRVRSPRIFTKGLWSVTTRRLSQPWVKYHDCSRQRPGFCLQWVHNAARRVIENEIPPG